MTDIELKRAVVSYKLKFGASYAFIARRCGVTREHLSRWINANDYVISPELKLKIISINRFWIFVFKEN